MTTTMTSPPPVFAPVADLDLSRMARAAGVIAEEEALSPQLREFALMVMEKCAAVGDAFVDDCYEDTAGVHIRRRFGID